jgi:hypothetical protein
MGTNSSFLEAAKCSIHGLADPDNLLMNEMNCFVVVTRSRFGTPP